jgi:hypothetical protein
MNPENAVNCVRISSMQEAAHILFKIPFKYLMVHFTEPKVPCPPSLNSSI